MKIKDLKLNKIKNRFLLRTTGSTSVFLGLSAPAMALLLGSTLVLYAPPAQAIYNPFISREVAAQRNAQRSAISAAKAHAAAAEKAAKQSTAQAEKARKARESARAHVQSDQKLRRLNDSNKANEKARTEAANAAAKAAKDAQAAYAKAAKKTEGGNATEADHRAAADAATKHAEAEKAHAKILADHEKAVRADQKALSAAEQQARSTKKAAIRAGNDESRLMARAEKAERGQTAAASKRRVAFSRGNSRVATGRGKAREAAPAAVVAPARDAAATKAANNAAPAPRVAAGTGGTPDTTPGGRSPRVAAGTGGTPRTPVQAGAESQSARVRADFEAGISPRKGTVTGGAVRLAEQALNKNPNDLQKQEQLRGAQTKYLKASGLDPKSEEFHNNVKSQLGVELDAGGKVTETSVKAEIAKNQAQIDNVIAEGGNPNAPPSPGGMDPMTKMMMLQSVMGVLPSLIPQPTPAK